MRCHAADTGSQRHAHPELRLAWFSKASSPIQSEPPASEPFTLKHRRQHSRADPLHDALDLGGLPAIRATRRLHLPRLKCRVGCPEASRICSICFLARSVMVSGKLSRSRPQASPIPLHFQFQPSTRSRESVRVTPISLATSRQRPSSLSPRAGIWRRLRAASAKVGVEPALPRLSPLLF